MKILLAALLAVIAVLCDCEVLSGSGSKPVPTECLTARNLTESWRLDHDGSDIRPGGPHSHDGYACDMHNDDTYWFRFTGAAGTRMLNTCPKPYSCGTRSPFWTDDVMPTAVGVATGIKAYNVWRPDCSDRNRYHEIEVMRCSEATHDYIYRQFGAAYLWCDEGFCGMM